MRDEELAAEILWLVGRDTHNKNRRLSGRQRKLPKVMNRWQRTDEPGRSA
jgi:hypothetical protein